MVMLRVVSRMVTNILGDLVLGIGGWGLDGKGWIQLAVLEVEMGWGYTTIGVSFVWEKALFYRCLVA